MQSTIETPPPDLSAWQSRGRRATRLTQPRPVRTATASLTEHLLSEDIQRIQDEFAVALGAPIRILDHNGHALTHPSLGCGTAALVAAAAVEFPVTADNRPLARVTVELPANAQTPERLRAVALLRILADMLAERWSRQRHLQQRLRELTGMFRLAGEVSLARDHQRILDQVANTIVDVLRVKGCCVYLLTQDRRELRLAASAGTTNAPTGGQRVVMRNGTVHAHVLTSRKPAYAMQTPGGLQVLAPGQAASGGSNMLFVPLSYKAWCEGVVEVRLACREELDWYELNLLQAVVAQATASVVGDRMHREAVEAHELRRHLRTAGEVQRRMIPQSTPALPGFELAAVYEPTYDLSGDFYDFVEMPGERLGIAVCDVVGKGARASLLMASIRSSLRAHVANGRSIGGVIEGVNRALAAETVCGDFATLFYGVLDPDSRRLTYVNAGHCPPLLVRNGRVRYLSTGGMLLGVDPDAPIRVRSLALRHGDVLLAYTDGLTEAVSFSGEQFGAARLERSLRDAAGAGLSAEMIARQLLWDMRCFAGLRDRADDLTMVALRVHDRRPCQ